MAASEPTVIDAAFLETLKLSKSPKIKRALEAKLTGVEDHFQEQLTNGSASPTP